MNEQYYNSSVLKATYSIPVEKLRAVGAVLEHTYLTVLTDLTKQARPTLTSEVVHTPSDPHEPEPAGRNVLYGNTLFGVRLEAEGIMDSQGVHGEYGSWTFYGLPTSIKMSGSSIIDYRGVRPSSASLMIDCVDSAMAQKIEENFKNSFIQ